MRSQPTPAPAAPATGAAQRETLAATMARLDALLAPAHPAAAARRPSYTAAPRSCDPLEEPATDPARWLGFL